MPRQDMLSQGLLHVYMDETLNFANFHWGRAFNPNNAIQTHSIFVKLSENTFLVMPKVRALSIFTLSMS